MRTQLYFAIAWYEEARCLDVQHSIEKIHSLEIQYSHVTRYYPYFRSVVLDLLERCIQDWSSCKLSLFIEAHSTGKL